MHHMPAMNTSAFHKGLRTFSYVVLGLMAAAIVYAGYISVTYWTGINV
jgi:hypothetical protein